MFFLNQFLSSFCGCNVVSLHVCVFGSAIDSIMYQCLYCGTCFVNHFEFPCTISCSLSLPSSISLFILVSSTKGNSSHLLPIPAHESSWMNPRSKSMFNSSWAQKASTFPDSCWQHHDHHRITLCAPKQDQPCGLPKPVVLTMTGSQTWKICLHIKLHRSHPIQA